MIDNGNRRELPLWHAEPTGSLPTRPSRAS